MLKFSQKPIEPEKYLPAFIEFCKRQDDIIALYIFGSRASGTYGPLSDIDIAVLLPQGLGRDGIWLTENSFSQPTGYGRSVPESG